MEETRKSSIEYKDNEIKKLENKIKEIKQQHLIEIAGMKQDFNNQLVSNAKLSNETIKEHEEKISRLQDELNDKAIGNKKLLVKLKDITELYEKLQDKLINVDSC